MTSPLSSGIFSPGSFSEFTSYSGLDPLSPEAVLRYNAALGEFRHYFDTDGRNDYPVRVMAAAMTAHEVVPDNELPAAS